ncbi:hypothetical protein FBU30_010828 [Linnemannia zychae]|nr:hypothetical protein FBU30_010828 [Linnemannia zychae]
MVSGTHAAPIATESPTTTALAATPTTLSEPPTPTESNDSSIPTPTIPADLLADLSALNDTVHPAAINFPDPACIVNCILAHNAGAALCSALFQGMDLARCQANISMIFYNCKRRC